MEARWGGNVTLSIKNTLFLIKITYPSPRKLSYFKLHNLKKKKGGGDF